MSVSTAIASAPRSRSSLARADAPAPSKSASTTLHPRAASWLVIAKPMQRGFAVPVTTATLTSKSCTCFPSFAGGSGPVGGDGVELYPSEARGLRSADANPDPRARGARHHRIADLHLRTTQTLDGRRSRCRCHLADRQAFYCPLAKRVASRETS